MIALYYFSFFFFLLFFVVFDRTFAPIQWLDMVKKQQAKANELAQIYREQQQDD